MLKLNFTTITPVHISNGEQLGFGLDYIIKNEAAFYKLNFLKIAEKFAVENLFNFSENYSLEDMIKIIDDKRKEITEDYIHYKVLITSPFNDHLNNEKAVGRSYVSEFINSNGKFYIPASAVKGALLTILNQKSLGINPDAANIKDKVVFSDSGFIDQSNFNIFCSNNRPPKVNLMCLKKNVEFSLMMKKTGNLNLVNFRKLLNEYSSIQIDNALNKLQPYKTTRDEPKGADIFEKALINLNSNSLSENEYLINLGFGGGSWFKVEVGKVPMFESKKKGRDNPKEPAHTSVSFQENPMHIGWCKLKIEEL